MTSGAHRAHQNVDRPELVEEFFGQTAIRLDVVGVVVLVGAPGAGVGGRQLRDAVLSRLLPSTDRVRLGDQIDIGAVGAQHVLHDGFHAGVGDHGDRVAVHHSGECQPQAQ